MAALNKIAPTSPSRQRPNETESSIANALYDLESNIPDMKSALRPLQFVSAREVSNPNTGVELCAVVSNEVDIRKGEHGRQRCVLESRC